MRLLIISTYFPPLNSIASLRPYSWAKYWSEAGHDVEVVTTSKKHILPEQALELPIDHFSLIEVDEFSLIQNMRSNYQAPPKGKASSRIKKAFQKLRAKTGAFSSCRMPDFSDLWAKKAWRILAKKGQWDQVVTTSGPYSVHWLGYHLKKSGLCKTWIADYRDLWTQNHRFRGMAPLTFLERYLEKQWLSHADLITTVSDGLTETMKQVYPKFPIKTIENGFEISDFQNLSSLPAFPKDEKIRFVHLGTIVKQVNPEPLFKAIHELRHCPDMDNAQFLFAGNTNELILELVQKYSVEKWVKVEELIPREKALRWMRDADRLLFFPWSDLKFQGILSGKIFEYIGSGTPIGAIGCSAMESSQKLIQDYDAGVLLGEDKDAIKKWILDTVNAERTGNKAVSDAFLERYSKERLANALLITKSTKKNYVQLQD